MLNVLPQWCLCLLVYGKGVKNSINIMEEATAVHTIEFTCWRAATVVVEMYSLMGMVAEITENFGPFCSKDFSSGVSSFLERLITHLSGCLRR